jgi:predicted membrane chloride channel (bestrophin family)
VQCCGICDKVAGYPIPLTYSMHTTRFLMVYITFLPLAFWSTMGWWTVFAASVIGMLLVRCLVHADAAALVMTNICVVIGTYMS